MMRKPFVLHVQCTYTNVSGGAVRRRENNTGIRCSKRIDSISNNIDITHKAACRCSKKKMPKRKMQIPILTLFLLLLPPFVRWPVLYLYIYLFSSYHLIYRLSCVSYNTTMHKYYYYIYGEREKESISLGVCMPIYLDTIQGRRRER